MHAHELKGLDFVAFDEDLPIRRDMDRFLREHDVTVQVTVHFDNLQMMKEAVAHGAGVSIMPARVMREEIAQRTLAAGAADSFDAVPSGAHRASQA